MKKNLFKTICLCLILTLLTVPVYAEDEVIINEEKQTIVQPMFTDINQFYNYFNINSNGEATIISNIRGKSNVDEVRVSAYLQKRVNGSWTTLKHWSTTQSGSYGYLSKNWYVASGSSYRIVSYGYVFKDGLLLESTSYVSDIKYY